MLDVAGHYARPNIFELIVHRRSHRMIRVMEEEATDDRGAEEVKLREA
jgi:hypothetical protein